jgi:1D-myo-inositol-triphosphate 3-kinase
VRQRYPFIQLAGHKGDFISGQGGIIYKKASAMEKGAYEALMQDCLKPMVPLYFKSVNLEDDNGGQVEYLEMQDLLGSFQSPSVMDVKMVSFRTPSFPWPDPCFTLLVPCQGLRTFLESEVTNSKRRTDLLEKLIKLDPKEPTEEEKQKGITKLRSAWPPSQAQAGGARSRARYWRSGQVHDVP